MEFHTAGFSNRNDALDRPELHTRADCNEFSILRVLATYKEKTAAQVCAA